MSSSDTETSGNCENVNTNLENFANLEEVSKAIEVIDSVKPNVEETCGMYLLLLFMITC